MIPNIVRGDRMAGLMAYLVGPGRANEHTEPHLVAGDPAMLAWYDDNELDHSAAMGIAKHLDRPRTAFGVEVTGGHVWHCSLSLRAEEGLLTDEKWSAIATEFVDRMGFGDERGIKAPCRWVAVRHGAVSTAGNDHVHLVNLVWEDGTKASIHLDRPRSQQVCRDLELSHQLMPLVSAEQGRASRGFHPAELEAQARSRARAIFEREQKQRADQGVPRREWRWLPAAERESLVAAQLRSEQPRWDLARRVRGCASASADEAEFVRRMRRDGLLVRARFAEGRTDVVTGYSVAAKPAVGERPIWYGGGHLARDLTLPRLRAEWPDSPEAASAAAAEWVAAKRHRRPVRPGREHTAPGPQLWEQCTVELQQLREQLRAVPVEDRETWARVARHTAGAFAAWSYRVEPTPGPLARTADALARSAELRRSPRTPVRAMMASAAGASLLLSSAMRHGQGPAAELILLRQLANLAKALYDMHLAAADARRAEEIARAVRTDLAQVAQQLQGQVPPAAGDTATGDPQGHQTGTAVAVLDRPGADPAPVGSDPAYPAVVDEQAAEAVGTARAGQRPARPLGSPIPTELTPDRPRIPHGPHPRPGRDDRER